MPPKRKASALKAALAFLSRREHARYELWVKLIKRGYAPDNVSDALDELADKGLLSEERFIEAYLKSRVQRGYGSDKIRLELRGKGVDLPLVENFLDGIDWLAEARKVVERKFGKASPSDKEESGQYRRYLRQRGFAWGTIDALIHGHDE